MRNRIGKFIAILITLLFVALPVWAVSGWEVLQHTDEFGDVIEDDWFAWNIIRDARMSNSATSNADAVIVFKVESPKLIQFKCHDYGLQNTATEFYIDDYLNISVKDDFGKILRLSEPTKYGHADILGGLDAIAIRDMMLKSDYVKFAISGDRTKYVFSVDTSDFESVLVELCERQGLNSDEISVVLDTELSLYEFILDEVLDEMNPYNSDKTEFNDSVLDFWIERQLESLHEYFPEYEQSVMKKFQERSYSEWIQYCSDYYGVDITRIKNMKKVEKVFSMLGISITKLGKTEVTAKPMAENDYQSSSNTKQENVEQTSTETFALPELPRFRYAENSTMYFYLRSYGLGLTSSLGENTANSFSMGLAAGYGGVFTPGSPHLVIGEFGWLYNGKNHAFEETLSYGYRKGLGMDFEMIIKAGIAFNMKSVPCITPYTSLYDDGISNELMFYFGGALGLQFNYFFDANTFLTFGINDRVLAPGVSMFSYEEVNAGVDNLLEGFVGIGISY